MLEPVAPRPTVRDAGAAMPDPEVRERPVRRTLAAAHRLRIVEEASAAREPGAVVALLRREGPCGSRLVEWRRPCRAGAPRSLARPRGRRPGSPLAAEDGRLRRRVAGLGARLGQAARIIEIQGKVSELLGIPLARTGGGGPGGP